MPKIKTQYRGKIVEVGWEENVFRNKTRQLHHLLISVQLNRTNTLEEAQRQIEKMRKHLLGKTCTTFIE